MSTNSKNFFTIVDDGLVQSWNGFNVFCNPPYGRDIGKWVKKCSESFNTHTNIVLLIPARTDTSYFHKYIYKKSYVQCIFINGRLHFSNKGSAPFPSLLVLFSYDPILHMLFNDFYYFMLDRKY